MPKIFNVNLLGIILAAIALYMVGFLWYGVLFMESWQKLTGVSGEGGMTPMVIGLGFLICLIPAFGLTAVLNWARISKLYPSVKIAIGIVLMIIMPVLLAGTIYQGEPIALLIIDGSHALVGWAVMAAVLSFFKSRS